MINTAQLLGVIIRINIAIILLCEITEAFWLLEISSRTSIFETYLFANR